MKSKSSDVRAGNNTNESATVIKMSISIRWGPSSTWSKFFLKFPARIHTSFKSFEFEWSTTFYDFVIGRLAVWITLINYPPPYTTASTIQVCGLNVFFTTKLIGSYHIILGWRKLYAQHRSPELLDIGLLGGQKRQQNLDKVINLSKDCLVVWYFTPHNFNMFLTRI